MSKKDGELAPLARYTLDASSTQKHKRERKNKKIPEFVEDAYFNGAITAADPETRSFSTLVLSEDNKNRPLYVCPDGHIFLETFNPYYKPAYDFLISIAEPVSRPRFIHEYQINMSSMYAAVSTGLTAEEIIRVLRLLSKCEVADSLCQQITETVNTVGKLKLILRKNRYYIESTQLSVLQSIANDPEIMSCRAENDPNFDYDDNNFIIVNDEEDLNTVIAGIGDSAIYGGTKRMMADLDLDEDDYEDKEPIILRRFEIRPTRIRKVRARALEIHKPLSDEYDFRADTTNPDLDIDLTQATVIRPYQEKALSRMFGGGRAKSGIIVLPCGAGKTLVGITAACTVHKSTIIFCNGGVPVQQWYDQLLRWTTIRKENIRLFTAKNNKEPLPEGPCVLITTYFMLTHSGVRNELTMKVIEQIRNREWGLMIIDEVHEMAAKTFSKVTEEAKAHAKLGLTATLVREDKGINTLYYLIGPKLYEANWIDLSDQGFIARVQCYEIWCKMTGEFYREYLKPNNKLPKKRIFSAMNPNKFQTVQRLIEYHEARGDKILVFSDIIWVLQKYGVDLNKPIICGSTSEDERKTWFKKFKTGNKHNCLFISKVGDKAIDLPSANVLIQICSHFGSRMQEAQRLGRILRPKPGRTDEYNAFFYTLISEDTKEMYFSSKRQQFLIDQGYSFSVEQHPEKKWPVSKPLMYSSVESQKVLLAECSKADETDGTIEKTNDDEKDTTYTNDIPSYIESVRSSDLSGERAGGYKFKNIVRKK